MQSSTILKNSLLKYVCVSFFSPVRPCSSLNMCSLIFDKIFLSQIWRVNSFEYKAVPNRLCDFSFFMPQKYCMVGSVLRLCWMTLRQQVGMTRDAFVHILSFPASVFVGKCKCSGGKPYENVQKTYDWQCLIIKNKAYKQKYLTANISKSRFNSLAGKCISHTL